MVLEIAMLAIFLVSVKSQVGSFFFPLNISTSWSTDLSEGSLVCRLLSVVVITGQYHPQSSESSGSQPWYFSWGLLRSLLPPLLPLCLRGLGCG